MAFFSCCRYIDYFVRDVSRCMAIRKCQMQQGRPPLLSTKVSGFTVNISFQIIVIKLLCISCTRESWGSIKDGILMSLQVSHYFILIWKNVLAMSNNKQKMGYARVLSLPVSKKYDEKYVCLLTNFWCKMNGWKWMDKSIQWNYLVCLFPVLSSCRNTIFLWDGRGRHLMLNIRWWTLLYLTVVGFQM